MSSKALSKTVRATVIALAVCGLAACGYILPVVGADFARDYPEFAHWYLPWLLFLLMAAAPCFAILALIWKAATAIRHEQVFTFSMARLVKTGSAIMLGDVAFFFAGNAIFLLLGMNHPGIFLLCLFLGVFGVALAVSSAVSSRYLAKTAALQEMAGGMIYSKGLPQ